MTERTQEQIEKLLAERMQWRDEANAVHDAKLALTMELEGRLSSMALVKSPAAPLAYVRAYTDFMLLAVTAEQENA